MSTYLLYLGDVLSPTAFIRSKEEVILKMKCHPGVINKWTVEPCSVRAIDLSCLSQVWLAVHLHGVNVSLRNHIT